jgi:hypothetical protein
MAAVQPGALAPGPNVTKKQQQHTTTSMHTPIFLQYKLINCKNEIVFIQTTHNPVNLLCTFDVCTI